MLPAMVAAWQVMISPPGFQDNVVPNGQSAEYLLIMLVRTLNILCCRGLRGGDPLLILEKNNTRQELLGSPCFKHLEIFSDELQIVLQPPNTILLGPKNCKNDYDTL